MNADNLFSDLCIRHGIPEECRESGTILLGGKDTKPLDRRLNAVTPVSFASVGGKIVGSSYPVLREEVGAHLERYADAPFSDEALGALDRLLRPYLAAWGYRPAPFPTRYAVSYLLPDNFVPDGSRILAGTRRITAEDLSAYENLTMIKPENDPQKPAFGYIRDGKILAVAAVNSAPEKTRCAEIGVECVKRMRQQGLGLSCVSALSEYLVREGKTVLYQHYVTNLPSGALAKKAGFVPVGAFFAYTAMQN